MKKLLTLAFILLGSLYATSQEVKEYDQYKRVSYVDKMGKYDFKANKYEAEVIKTTTIKFMRLTNDKIGVAFIRFNIDMGFGSTTQDYLIMEEGNSLHDGENFTTVLLLSPFGDEMLFWYSDNQMYLFKPFWR
jgi:hypothetical protein